MSNVGLSYVRDLCKKFYSALDGVNIKMKDVDFNYFLAEKIKTATTTGERKLY